MATGKVHRTFMKIEDGPEGKFAYYAPSYNKGRYKTLKLLNSGGMGYILLVKDTWSGSPVVLKGAWWDDADLRPQAAEIQYKERTASTIKSVRVINELSDALQAVPAVIDVFHEPISPTRTATFKGPPEARYAMEPFAVYEFIGDPQTLESENLASYIKRVGRLSEMELLDFAEQIIAQLVVMNTIRYVADTASVESAQRAYCWVHTDIKPLNILMLHAPRRYLLIDLDDAVQFFPRSQEQKTPKVATQSYTRDQYITRKYDVFSFALTLYEAATGSSPYELAQDGDRLRNEVMNELGNLGLSPILIRLVADSIGSDAERRLGVRQIQQGLIAVRQSLISRRVLDRWSQ